MDHAEVVHILQALCNVNQLNIISARLLWGQAITYEFNAVNVRIPLDELIDVPIIHIRKKIGTLRVLQSAL